MRITRQLLLKNAQDTVARRVASEDGLLAAYLCGSLLPGREPLLGGTADIDLVFVYETSESMRREIVRLTDEVHLDIVHRSRADYEPARDLRERVWLGHEVNSAHILHDTNHFFDFIQAGARSLFDTSEYVTKRAMPFFERARETWFAFYNDMPAAPGPAESARYLSALEDVANGYASLSGPPLGERRFLLDLPARAEALAHPELPLMIAGLLGVGEVDAETVRGWLPAWQAAFLAAVDDARLHPRRLQYYRGAIEALLDDGDLPAALWPLLRTWTDAVASGDALEHLAAWQVAAEALRLLGEADGQPSFPLRINGLDALLDRAEEFMEGQVGASG